MPGQTAKGSPAGAATKSAAPLTPARTYQTGITLGWVTNTLLGAMTPIPAPSFQFYSNISWGAIDNTHTKAWVWLLWNNSGVPTYEYNFTLNGTVNTSAVITNLNNGVWFSNYTWTVTLDKTTLNCKMASCADNVLVTSELPWIFEVFVKENGASLGGGLASASLMTPTTPIFPGTVLVATFVSASIVSPVPVSMTPVAAALPFEVQVLTNTSWGWSSALTTFLSVQISNDTAPYGAPTQWNFSFDKFPHFANKVADLNVTSIFNGTVAGVNYSSAMWSFWVTNKTLGCGTQAACVAAYGLGKAVNITVWVSENGSRAGGQDNLTSLAATESLDIGSTFINVGAVGVPVPVWGYEATPYRQTGWLNVTYVNPTSDKANTTFGGYAIVTDVTTSTLVGYISFNSSYTADQYWFNPDGVQLMTAYNGSYVVGNSVVGLTEVSYENYTWTMILSAAAGSLGAVIPYNHIYDVTVVPYANGTVYGGVNQTTSTDVITTVFVQYPTTAAAKFTSTFLAYNPVPLAVTYNITVVNAPVSSLTTTILVNVTDVTAGYVLLTSTPVTVLNNQTSYKFSVDAATLMCNNPQCSGLPNDEFELSVFIGVNGINGTTNGSLSSDLIAKTFFLIPTPLSASLVSPISISDIPTGNVTVSVEYLGSWVAGATINIYASTGAIVFTHSMIELTPGVPTTATWFVGSAGAYTYSIVMTTVYLPTTHYFNGTLTVVTHGGNVYTNTTQWSNQSIISGLAGAVSGTILLVVGLVVGMIVALVLARAVMGRPAQAPPQPWESKPGAAAAAPNTCSVCGKSFATPEELAAHGKAEHGMQ